jgi:hypothetical protein
VGTVPEWISAIATVGALIAAWLAGTTAKRLYGVESDRDATAAEQRERHDADLVHAWTTAVHRDGTRPRYGLIVKNGSSSPVFDVTIQSTTGIPFEGGHKRAWPVDLAMLPPGEYFVTTVPYPDTNTGEDGIPEPTSGLDGTIRPVMKKRDWAVSRIHFTDASGRHWQRDKDGVLTRAPASARA